MYYLSHAAHPLWFCLSLLYMILKKIAIVFNNLKKFYKNFCQANTHFCKIVSVCIMCVAVI